MKRFVEGARGSIEAGAAAGGGALFRIVFQACAADAAPERILL